MIEMMVVIAIMVVLMGLAIPALSSRKAEDLTMAAYDVQGALELARGYAVANNTYTWVGFFEEDVTKSSAQPAVSGVGRVVISVVASRDGTSIFSEPAAETTGANVPAVQSLPPARLLQLTKLVKLEDIHICTPKSTSSTFNNRPGATINDKDRVGLSSAGVPLLFNFQYPLIGTHQYTFGIRPAPSSGGFPAPSGIVMFNPQGEAISDGGPVPGVSPCKEIAIQATHGKIPDQGINVAAIDINGLTGLTTIYRP